MDKNSLSANDVWSPDKVCLIGYLPPITTSHDTAHTQCDVQYFGICFVKAEPISDPIFGFSVFVTALALLIGAYTVTDARYRFRMEIAPFSLIKAFYYLAIIVGIGTLLNDIWFEQNWLIPNFLSTQAFWQSGFAAAFLLIIIFWIRWAFVHPPVFSKFNAKKYADTLYKKFLEAPETDWPIIANELGHSADQLVKLGINKDLQGKNIENEHISIHYAYEMLLLIGNRKLCKHIIASSPVTAIKFFKAISEGKKYPSFIGQFVQNISIEAIKNKDSILYHEDDGYDSGLIGYIKPFSQAVYGDYNLVENLARSHRSPLDLPVRTFDAVQLEAYARVALLFSEKYLEKRNREDLNHKLFPENHKFTGSRNIHSDAFYQMLDNIKRGCSDLYKLNGIKEEYYSSDILNRFEAVVGFGKDLIELVNKNETIPQTSLRNKDQRMRKDMYDRLAEFVFDLIFTASTVKSDSDKCWLIHYNVLWDKFFGFSEGGKASKIIYFKLRRLLYQEIKRLEKSANYKSARILGICLNVMGFKLSEGELHDKEYHALHKVILKWTQANYLKVRARLPDVADACLMGSISFDESTSSLVKTYAKGLNKEAPQECLKLCGI